MIYKALELMHSFGGFILTLIGIIIAIVNLSKKITANFIQFGYF
ncbi:putative holin-like toxin [Streptococcus porcinus]|nr:putative holin-like toxin [Streptococcus porcinus]